MFKLRKHAVELFIGGGVLIIAFNYLFEPGNSNSGFSVCIGEGCNTPLPSLYFIGVVLIVLGLAQAYRKHFHK